MKKLVLVDLDSTLIDPDYKPNMSIIEFSSLIKNLNHNGVSVGLCSDSAVITLQQWSDNFGLSGPIISERGAVIWDFQRRKEIILNPVSTSWFHDLRIRFIEQLKKEFPATPVFVGDATLFKKDYNLNKGIVGNVFAVNGYRQASFSFFALRRSKDGLGLEPDQEMLKVSSSLLVNLISEYQKVPNDLFWDENPKYGVLILHDKTTEKWRAVSRLIKQYQPEQTIMIGDSMADYLNLQGVLQFAVSNATIEYQQNSDFVAEASITQGVYECLKRLM